MDHRVDEHCRIVHHLIGDILGQARLELLQHLLDCGGYRDRVRPGRLVDNDPFAGPAIVTNDRVGRLRAEFGAGDVLDADDPAVWRRADDDVVELLDCRQPPLRADVQLKLDLGHERRRADAADRGLGVLRIDRIDDVGGSNVEARHPVEVEPDPHRVFEVAPLGRIAHTRHPLQGVDHVDLGVIRQEQRVAAALWRVDRDDLQ